MSVIAFDSAYPYPENSFRITGEEDGEIDKTEKRVVEIDGSYAYYKVFVPTPEFKDGGLNNIGSIGTIETLEFEMKGLPTLEDLQLLCNQLRDYSKISELSLVFTDFPSTPGAIALLCNTLAEKKLSTLYLHLKMKGAQNNQLNALSSIISESKTLENLRLAIPNCGVTDEVVKKVADAVAENNTLKSFSMNLRNNSISGHSAECLSAGISRNTSISHLTLVLSDNELQTEGSEHLLRAIFERNTRLKEVTLFMKNVRISRELAFTAAKLIESNSNIVDLCARLTFDPHFIKKGEKTNWFASGGSNCEFSVEEEEEIIKCTKENATLEYLDLKIEYIKSNFFRGKATGEKRPLK